MQKEPGVRKGSAVYTQNVCTQALGVGEESACCGRRCMGAQPVAGVFLPGTHSPTLPAVGGAVTRAQAESAEGSPERGGGQEEEVNMVWAGRRLGQEGWAAPPP